MSPLKRETIGAGLVFLLVLGLVFLMTLDGLRTLFQGLPWRAPE